MRLVCTTCKHARICWVAYFLQHHPDAIAFYHARGVEVAQRADDPARFEDFFEHRWVNEETVLPCEPPRVRVTLRCRGDELRLTVDENLRLAELEESA